ncbi:MAG: PAS domain-containing protein [Solirubrobacterales bacterium]
MQQQKPLELILARNFLTSLSTPAFLTDDSAALIFYNEAAGALLGISFEESGRLEATQWSRTISPFGESGEPTPIEERAMTKALRQGRPAHGRFKIRSTTGEEFEVEASALPIVAEGGQEGAMIFFWTQNNSRAG